MKDLKTQQKLFLSKSKKGMAGMNKVPGVVMLMGLSIIIGVLMTIIVTDVAATTSDANATEIATGGKNGMVKIFSFFVLIGLVVAAGIVIKILTGGFGGK